MLSQTPVSLAGQALPCIHHPCRTNTHERRRLAADVYRDLRHQVLRVPERRYDTHVAITLTPWTVGPAEGEEAMFVATIRWDYRVTGSTGVRRFASVSDRRVHDSLLRDPTITGVWLFDPTPEHNAESPDVFALVDYTIDGVPQPIHREHHPDTVIYTVPGIEPGPDEGCQVSYTYRVLAPQHGHLLFLDFDKPSKGVQIDFAYTGCGIKHVNAVDFLAGAKTSRIHHSSPTVPTSVISLSYDGWIFPKSGIAYTWSLDTEFPD